MSTDNEAVPSTEELLQMAAASRTDTAKVVSLMDLAAKQAEIDLKKQNLKFIQELVEWNDASDKYLKDLREFRFAAISEIANVKNELADIRRFFLADGHHEEIRRLREFIDLCERLAKLKKDGTLDALAETIIKLS